MSAHERVWRRMFAIGILSVSLQTGSAMPAWSQENKPEPKGQPATTQTREFVWRAVEDKVQAPGRAAAPSGGGLSIVTLDSSDEPALTLYRDRVGKSFEFQVCGRETGSIWGGEKNVYTDDSSLAVAAVHAGILRAGQSGVVNVTILPGRDSYGGSERHGVTSRDYGVWEGSYQISQPKARAMVLLGEKAKPNPGASLDSKEPAPQIEAHPPAVIQGGGEFGIVLNLGGAQGPASARRSIVIRSAVGHVEGSVWGDDIYTDDSDLGAAAVHAGVLKVGEKASLALEMLPGRSMYPGSTKNGVTSSGYGSWTGSFAILGIVKNESAKAEPKSELKKTIIRPAMIEDPGTLQTYRGKTGVKLLIKVTGNADGSVWGDGVYTDDSSLAAAAVHAGALKVGETGLVDVTITQGQESYSGSERNGVTSRSWGTFGGSFKVQKHGLKDVRVYSARELKLEEKETSSK